jgi:hypothetical protein
LKIPLLITGPPLLRKSADYLDLQEIGLLTVMVWMRVQLGALEFRSTGVMVSDELRIFFSFRTQYSTTPLLHHSSMGLMKKRQGTLAAGA